MIGVSQPGTRINRRLDEKSDLWTYVKQALVGALAVDLFLFCVELSGLLFGWLTVPLVFAVGGFGFALALVFLFHPVKPLAKLIVGNLGPGMFLLGCFVGIPLWNWIVAGAIEQIIRLFVAPLQFEWMPWWGYWAIFSLAIFAALIRKTRIISAALFAVTISYLILQFDNPALVAQAWARLRIVAIPYLAPVAFFALTLAIVMFKELLFPSLEWVARPVSLEELREIGLMGLWFPMLLTQWIGRTEKPIAERTVKIEVVGGDKHAASYATLPDYPEVLDFFGAVLRGESFALRTARKYTLSRRDFVNIREVLIGREWAEWVDEKNHEQGINITDEGWQVLEHLVLTGTTPTP